MYDPNDPAELAAIASKLTDLVRDRQRHLARMAREEVDRCAAQVNAMPLSFSAPQDPSTWATPEVLALPVVPFRQHYDPRTGHLIVTLIDPEDFYV